MRRAAADLAADEAVDSSSSSADAVSGRPLSHADAIAAVHGGLRGSDVAAACTWTDAAGAQVYPIDRPYQETQNLVARRLLLRPRELRDFVQHSAGLLTGSAGHSGAPSLSLGMREVLEDEREQHMATEVLRRGVHGADIAIICTSDRAAGLERLLLGSGVSTGKSKPSSAARVWPFLLVLVYVIVPVYGLVFVAWRASRVVAGMIQGGGMPTWLPEGSKGPHASQAPNEADVGRTAQ